MAVVFVRVFGLMFGPSVSMFFASWKSDEIILVCTVVPAASAGTESGSGNVAMPVLQS